MIMELLLGSLLIGGLWYVWEKSRRRTYAVAGGYRDDIEIEHEQEWELYHNDFSLCSKKTRVCLTELGLSYRSHHIDLVETGSYENLSARYLKVHPGGILPLLVHNGHPVFESHEQIVYAALTVAGDNPLIPADDKEKAVMDRWVHKGSLIGEDPIRGMKETAGNSVPGLTMPIFATMIESIPWHRIVVGLLFHRARRRPMMFMRMKSLGAADLHQDERMTRVIQMSRLAMHTHLDELEAELANTEGDWIVGNQFTLADVSMMVILERLAEVDWEEEFLTGRPGVSAYWKRLKARPSYQTALAAHIHPTVAQGLERIRTLKAENPEFKAALLGSPN